MFLAFCLHSLHYLQNKYVPQAPTLYLVSTVSNAPTQRIALEPPDAHPGSTHPDLHTEMGIVGIGVEDTFFPELCANCGCAPIAALVNLSGCTRVTAR